MARDFWHQVQSWSFRPKSFLSFAKIFELSANALAHLADIPTRLLGSGLCQVAECRLLHFMLYKPVRSMSSVVLVCKRRFIRLTDLYDHVLLT